MDYLRGPQDQVLEKWWTKRDKRDLVLKMNTGGGKTTVGLLIAQSSLAEGIGPVAYLVPDHYLVDQVLNEAARLGLPVVTDARSFDFARGRAILVDVFQRLFNGSSVFGVGGSAGREAAVPQPKTVIIDDAHACLNKAEQAFRMTVPAGSDAYDNLLALFGESLSQQSPSAYLDLVDRRSHAVEQVPYWAWIDKQREVLEILHPLSASEPHKFTWPLLVDVLSDCRAVFTADSLEISAPCLNSDILLGFSTSARRVYLTASLADDGVLVTDFGADPTQVAAPITPANAGDIGDRLILVPQQTHYSASEAEIRDLILDLSQGQNVAVIVPSAARAAYWASEATMVLDRTNLTSGVDAMRANAKSGLYVFVNRYDGVDLPGDACHVLVIDGLPEALAGTERLEAAQLVGTDLLVAKQVQRLEQGMGRATRSNDDYCVVFLLGSRLAERLHSPQARASFSPATRAQIELSEEIGDQLIGTDTDTLKQTAQQCLDRDPEWLAASRSRLATLRYGVANVRPESVHAREAFQYATSRDYRSAVAATQRSIDVATTPLVQAYFKQQLAAYQHHIDPVAAQKTQKSANSVNHSLLRPMDGVVYERIEPPARAQGAVATTNLQERYASPNDLVVGLNALRDDLDWGPNAEQFESAWARLALLLGFASQRPEAETGRGPDCLWALPDGSFHVIEAKSGATATHPVYKKSAEQLSNAMDWFDGEYTSIARATPVLIHPQNRFDRKAAIPRGCRVVTSHNLTHLRDELKQFIVELAEADAFRAPDRVAKLLAVHRFTADTFLTAYTTAAIAGR